MSSSSVLIWGAGGHGRVVADLVELLGNHLNGFVDRDISKAGVSVAVSHSVVMSEDQLCEYLAAGELPPGIDWIVPAIGDNGSRMRILKRLGRSCAPPLVHPSATVSRHARIGMGSVVLAGAVVNAGASVGSGVIINTAALVEHDCTIGDGAHVSPGAVLAGEASIGRESWIGANATILPRVTVGNGAIVGAGAVVLRDLPDWVTAVGNPARTIDRILEHAKQ